MNIFRRDEEAFITDLAPYRGNYRGRQGGMMCWEVNDPDREPFKSIVEVACLRVSQCRSIPRSALLLIDIFIRGQTLETSAAYLMLAGSTERQRKAVVKHLRRSPLLQEYTGLKIDHWDWPPRTQEITLTGKNEKMSDTDLVYKCPRFEIRRPAPRTTDDVSDISDVSGVRNGTLLSIVATNDTEETFRAGTLSCAVMVGRDIFLVSPAHIFMPRPPEEPEENVEDSESDSGSEALRAGSVTPPNLDAGLSSSQDSDDIMDDIIQTRPSSMAEVEQPYSPQPLPGADGFHIFSPEHDFALIPLPQSQSFHTGLCLMSTENVQRIIPGQVLVSLTTPSLGVMHGSLEGRPTFMRLPYSSKFVKLYPARFPNAVSEGDCGSLVVNRDTKKICGFVAAASKEAKIAYIIPADEIIREISARRAAVPKPTQVEEPKESGDDDGLDLFRRPRKDKAKTNNAWHAWRNSEHRIAARPPMVDTEPTTDSGTGSRASRSTQEDEGQLAATPRTTVQPPGPQTNRQSLGPPAITSEKVPSITGMASSEIDGFSGWLDEHHMQRNRDMQYGVPSPNAEPVGLISGILTLAVFAFNSSSKLLKEIQNFKSLPRQVRELLTELSGLTLVLQELSEMGDVSLDIDLTALKLTLEQCRKSCDDVKEELLTYCRRSGPDRASFRDWLKLKCGGGDGIEGFRQQLIGYKSIITVALSFANLRASAAGAEAIQACQDSIATTTFDLEAHLEDIQQKLDVLTQRTTASTNPDTAVLHHMKEDRLRTEKALQFCTLLSQQIEQAQVDFFNGAYASQTDQDLGSTSEMNFGEGLEGRMHHMRFTLAHLEERQNRLRERLGRDSTAVSAEAQASLSKLQHEARTLRRGLDFCSNVDARLESQISNIENHAEGNDTIQFMVSTNGQPLKGSNHGVGDMLKQAGGHYGDASLQQVSQDFKSVALHQTSSREHDTKLPASTPGDDAVPAGSDTQFGSRHGQGFTLAKYSAPSAPSGAPGI